MPTDDSRYFLFSLDLEDVRLRAVDGGRFAERVPDNTDRYLDFLKRWNARATFFTVGEMARRYPGLIRRLVDEGHEVACHSDTHLTLDQHTPQSFRADLAVCRKALEGAGVKNVEGYRAPVFSLTDKTKWVYPILEEMGFRYSSSVLPAANPLHGWPGFGEAPRRIGGLWEIPMTLSRGVLRVPFGGGTYFRLLPKLALHAYFARASREAQAITSYFHPYDVDTEQEYFRLPELGKNPLFQYLMYHGRKGVFTKLESLMRAGYRIVPYREYVANLTARDQTAASAAGDAPSPRPNNPNPAEPLGSSAD